MMWDEEISEGGMWGPQPTRARLGVLARPGGLCLPPSDVICTENSEKIVLNFHGILRTFILGSIFYCTGNSENRQNMAFYFI